MTILTREQLNALVAALVLVISAFVPELRSHLDVIAPAVVAILALLLGIPAAERAAASYVSYKSDSQRRG